MSFENHIVYEDRSMEITRAYRDSERQQLEHSLATTFITLQREKNPAERQRLWAECLRLAKELEELTNE